MYRRDKLATASHLRRPGGSLDEPGDSLDELGDSLRKPAARWARVRMPLGTQTGWIDAKSERNVQIPASSAR